MQVVAKKILSTTTKDSIYMLKTNHSEKQLFNLKLVLKR